MMAIVQMPEDSVGLDTQCLTYLIDAMQAVEEPTDTLAEERKALIRIFFYTPGTFYVSETVLDEVARIRGTDRRALHDNYVLVLFNDPPIVDQVTVNVRVEHLLGVHPHKNDCRILAEAEDLGLNVLLSYDRRFLSRLGKYSNSVDLCEPSRYWRSLDICRGAKPKWAPHPKNPLSKQDWWKW